MHHRLAINKPPQIGSETAECLLTSRSRPSRVELYTVLRKRNLSHRFDHFDPEKVRDMMSSRWHPPGQSWYYPQSTEKCLRQSITPEVLEVQEAFGSFATYLWRFVDGKPMCMTSER